MHLSILFSVLALAAGLPQQRSYAPPNVGNRRQEQQQQQVDFSSVESTFGSNNVGTQDLSAFQRIGPSADSFESDASFSQGSFNAGNQHQQFQGSFDNDDHDSQENFNLRAQSQDSFETGFQSQGGFNSNLGPCRDNEIRHVDGSCVEPEISRNLFLYNAPAQQVLRQNTPLNLPKPKIIHNVVFVRTPDQQQGQEPIVIPPPQEKTVVYVLNKNGQIEGQRVIEVPAGPAQQPEVIYVNYEEGSNPQLPIGVDLQTALASIDAREAQVIGAGAGSSGGHSGGNFQGGNRSFHDDDDSQEDNFRGGFSSGNQGHAGNNVFQSTNSNRNSFQSSSNNQGRFRGQKPSRSYGTP